MEPREHLARAEELQDEAENLADAANERKFAGDAEAMLRRAEVLGVLAQARALMAWACFLSADADPVSQISVQASRARRRDPDAPAYWPPRRPS